MYTIRGMKDRLKLGKYLLQKRLEAELTQRTLGSSLGFTSGQFISNYEKGLAPVPLSSIKVLIKILKLDPYRVVELIQEERLSYLLDELNLESRKIRSHRR